MAISRNNSPQDDRPKRDPIFAPGGEPVRFYLWGTNEPDSRWKLSDGRRDALIEKIKVSALHRILSGLAYDTGRSYPHSLVQRRVSRDHVLHQHRFTLGSCLPCLKDANPDEI